MALGALGIWQRPVHRRADHLTARRGDIRVDAHADARYGVGSNPFRATSAHPHMLVRSWSLSFAFGCK